MRSAGVKCEDSVKTLALFQNKKYNVIVRKGQGKELSSNTTKAKAEVWACEC